MRRSKGPTTRFDLILSNKKYSVKSELRGEDLLINVQGRVFRVRLDDEPSGEIKATVNGEETNVSIVDETSSGLVIRIDGKLTRVERPPALLPLGERSGPRASIQEGVLLSPLPGVVVSIEVREGEKVEVGAPLLTIAAMKMESIIRADRDATIDEISVKREESVRKGQPLLRYAKEGS